MSTISVTKCFEFEAAHCLPYHKGKCKNIHGHTYKLEVEVGMEENDLMGMEENYGMVVDFGILKDRINDIVINIFDHKYLNDAVTSEPCLREFPTAENLCIFIAKRIRRKTEYDLLRIRLWETSTSYAEWRK